MTGLLPAVSTQLPLCFSLHRHKSFTVSPPQLSVAKVHRQQQERLSPFMSFSSLSTSSTGSVTEQEQTEESPPLPSSSSSLVESVVDGELLLSSSGCKACGRELIERGCNGEGRIQGGIATVPGFGWWPIKAYRPCPGFLASGGNYRRRGQSMDEVAFGGGNRGTSMDNTDELENRNKGKDRRRFKR